MVKLNIVGAGPGSPEYVTPLARKTVKQADLVIGAQRSLNLFAEDIKGEKVVLTAKNLDSLLKLAAESAHSGKNVALLSTGDPGFSGLLRTILESGLVTAEQINVVPAVSSVQACAAKLGLSWDNAVLFTFHEGNVDDDQKQVLDFAVSSGQDVIVLPDSKVFTPKNIATYLISEGRDKDTPVYVCENLTLPDEKITASTLAEVSKQAFGSLSVMVIKAKNE